MAGEPGWLSAGEREFLTETDHEGLTSPENGTKRYRLRQRVKNGLEDVQLLLNQWPESERRLTFGPEDDADPTAGRAPGSGGYGFDFRHGHRSVSLAKGEEAPVESLAATVQFCWEAALDAHVDPADLVTSAIAEAQGGDVEVRLRLVRDAAVRRSRAARGRDKMAAGEELTDREATALTRQPEEAVPNGLVFDYLRGELEEYDPGPLPFERDEE